MQRTIGRGIHEGTGNKELCGRGFAGRRREHAGRFTDLDLQDTCRDRKVLPIQALMDPRHGVLPDQDRIGAVLFRNRRLAQAVVITIPDRGRIVGCIAAEPLVAVIIGRAGFAG